MIAPRRSGVVAQSSLGRLEGRTALITGGSSGIGAATARRFVAEGAAVALLARSENALADVASGLGDRAYAITADVSDPTRVAEAMEAAWHQLGGIEIVVNAAGIANPAFLVDVDVANWREMIDVNLSGTFYVAREAALRMIAHGGGSIINIGSELSLRGVPMYSAYCAAKAGVVGLTKAMAAELAPSVTVNAVLPGPVDTPMLVGELALFPNPETALEGALDRVPLRRLAQPEEIAAAILYLAADGGYATGSCLVIDGGTTGT